jgi:hypothetical protein
VGWRDPPEPSTLEVLSSSLPRSLLQLHLTVSARGDVKIPTAFLTDLPVMAFFWLEVYAPSWEVEEAEGLTGEMAALRTAFVFSTIPPPASYFRLLRRCPNLQGFGLRTGGREFCGTKSAKLVRRLLDLGERGEVQQLVKEAAATGVGLSGTWGTL